MISAGRLSPGWLCAVPPCPAGCVLQAVCYRLCHAGCVLQAVCHRLCTAGCVLQAVCCLYHSFSWSVHQPTLFLSHGCSVWRWRSWGAEASHGECNIHVSITPCVGFRFPPCLVYQILHLQVCSRLTEIPFVPCQCAFTQTSSCAHLHLLIFVACCCCPATSLSCAQAL